MKSNQNQILNYANHLNPLAHALAGGGNAPLIYDKAFYLAHYQTHKFQSYESISQKSITLGRFLPYAVAKALKMLRQSKQNKSARSANLCLHSVIVRFCVAKSWQSIFAIRQIRFYVIDFICCLKSRGLDCHALPKASLAMTISSSDSHKFKSRGLDTSLHCVPLSMTRWGRFVILMALARSIHFSDFRITRDSLTLSESMRLHFGLLRRIYDSPRNDKVGKFIIARFTQIAISSLRDSAKPNRGNPLSTPLLKESKCKLKRINFHAF